MKSKLLISGLLISITILTASCTNDDYEIPETKNSKLENTKINKLQNEVRSTVIDSTKTINETTLDDGEPSNPKPPKVG